MRTRTAALLPLVLLAVLLLAGVALVLNALQPERPSGGAAVGATAGVAGGPGVTPRPVGSGAPIPSLTPDTVDTVEGIDVRPPVAIPARVELYPRTVSVAPGEPVALCVSTPARTYRFVVDRVDATLPGGLQRVASVGGRPGHDYRSRATFEVATRTARANWPVTDTLATAGWTPGVYIVSATDSNRTVGQAIFVVRTPLLVADRPAFVFTALTYEAYNMWGGANLYSYAGRRAVRVSFDRPYALEDGKGYWNRDDDRILRWLQLHRVPLQYTTDYDLSVAPPAVAPRLLILPRHAEYVPGSLRDWLEQHVNASGDMNVLSYGANGFYWQVRLAPAPGGAPMSDVVCWKEAAQDPMTRVDPSQATVRWREAPLLRPEGSVFGAQFSGVVGDGFTRSDFVVTSAVPAELLAGTGWTAGTTLSGLLLGETDAAFPGSGGIPIMDGRAVDAKGVAFPSSVTIRTSSAGARVFDAGTFAWADGFAPPATGIGVSAASFDRFNRNVLAWLGFPVGG